jgi:DNA invertase Pin-like site-specific DNA recombinase
MIYGYARVSAQDQELATQLQQLDLAGAERIFKEKISGATTSRPELDKMLEQLRPGDTVMVARLNRLGRSTIHLLELVDKFRKDGIRFISLDLGIDTGNVAGKLVLGIFSCLAEYDREISAERRTHGIALAKERGKHLGRRAGLDKVKLAKIEKALEASLSVADVVHLTGYSLSTVKRYKRQLEAATEQKKKSPS